MTAPQDGEAVWVAADRIRFLGGLPGTGAELVEVEVPPGSGTPPHSHASAELFYILEGALTLRQFPAGDEPPVTIQAGPGCTLRIAPWQPHGYANESGAPVRMLVLLEPGMTAFFRDIGMPAPEARPDIARIGAAMDRHGIAMLPPAA
ncbi:cupin domain-containing protein [Poseidonocella sp. HB161398]|uniref:cupin domain-containing protein n=1 Tax=Poseidonocella sp. HB161398 TaxID=2320855 RepID=UPI00197DB475|nr:cupin domain-containing protein [Poseidonocella sp. HB161398]